jgi:PAS domain S-box-containing protein
VCRWQDYNELHPPRSIDGFAAMNRIRDSVVFRLFVTVLLFSTTVTLCLTAMQIYLDYRHGVETIQSRMVDIEKGYLGGIGNALWRLDEQQLRIELDGILQFPDIRAAEVRELTDRGTPMTVAAGHRTDDQVLAREFPIVRRIDGVEREIGVLRVEATLANLHRQLVEAALIILAWQGTKTFIVALFIMVVLWRLVTRHLAAIASHVESYSPDRPTQPLKLQRFSSNRNDELERVVSAFNGMAKRLQEAYQSLRRANADLQQENLQRRLTEDALRASEARMRRLIESNIIGICFGDIAGHVTEANDAFLAIVGYSRQDLLSQKINWAAFTAPEYREADERAIAELMERGTCTLYEKELVRKDGGRTPVLAGGAFLEGSREQGVGFFLDMTERKQAEIERAARRAAEAANHSKSAFLANMSHELRTPLNGILGYAQILRQDRTLGERHLARLNVIQQSGEHLLTLINDILDFAKIEAGKQELYPVDFSLSDFLHGISGVVEVKALQKNLNFHCEFPADLPRRVRGDEKRLRQVLLNLLSNAVKFTDRGEVRLRVQSMPPARIRFQVNDTGIGIGKEQIRTLFQPFEQAGDIQRRLGGSGLGLAISRQLVRLMGGDIRVDSCVGEGTNFCFDVELPTVEAAAARMEPPGYISGYQGPRKTILVIDDIAENRTVVADMLAQLGFDVQEASDTAAGLACAQKAEPDLILMDIVMPEIDGLQAISMLRQDPALSDIPVIAVSASASTSDREASLAVGANTFLPKPIDFDRLLEKIADLLKLVWTYEPWQTVPQAESDEDRPMIAPPQEEIVRLYELARLGNLQEIGKRAARLAALDERYRPFGECLGKLAKGYQSKAVFKFVKEHLVTVEAPQDASR